MTGKRVRILGIISAAALIVTVISPSYSQSDERIVMRCNSTFPLASALSTAQIRWGEELEQRSDGRISTEDFSQAFYRSGEALDGLGGGLAPCGSFDFYFPEAMPVANDLGSMPFLWTEQMYADKVNIPFVGEVLTEELANSGILPLIGAPSAQSFFMRRPLPNGAAPEDMSKTFEGLRIRTWGIYTDVVNLLGGTPISMPASEVPVALRQGLIDGLVTSWDTWKSLSMMDDAPHAYHIPAVGGSMFGMNLSAFQRLSEEDQQLIRDVARDVAAEVAEASATAKVDIIEETRQHSDRTVTDLSDEDVQRWIEAISPIIENYTSRGERQQEYYDTLLNNFRDGYTPSWER